MAALKNYNPTDIVMIIAGIPLESGRGDDTFAKGEWTSPRWTTKVGCDGEKVRSKSNDKGMRWTITTLQTSQANALLNALFILDTNAANGAGVGPFMVKDRQGLTLYAGAQCWVAEPPNPEFGKEATTRDWIVEVASVEGGEGGN
jgi:hypothetical protein